MFNPSSPQAMRAADCALAVLEHLEVHDQLAAAGWAAVAVLGALRSRCKKTPEECDAFDHLCSETEAWLRGEIGALRFTREH